MPRYSQEEFEYKLEFMRPTKPKCLLSQNGRIHKRKAPEEILESKPIPMTFGQSPEGQNEQVKVLYVHEHLLRRSPVCRTMLDGQFKEGANKEIQLPECDPHTGARLLQWFYTGDYEANPLEHPDADLQYSMTGDTSSRNAVREAQQDSRILSEVQNGPCTASVQPNSEIRKMEQDDSWKMSYSTSGFDKLIETAKLFPDEASMMAHHEVLMQHAKMYTIADYLGLLTLQKMASKRLRTHLIWIDNGTVPRELVDDVIDLAGYLYENTNDDSTKKIDETVSVRKYTSRFLAGHSTCMTEDMRKKIAGDAGDFVSDYMTMVQDVMAQNQHKATQVEQELNATKAKQTTDLEPKYKTKKTATKRGQRQVFS